MLYTPQEEICIGIDHFAYFANGESLNFNSNFLLDFYNSSNDSVDLYWLKSKTQDFVNI